MKQLIYQREKSLLEVAVRQSPEKLNELIADDFVEFGVSGKIYNKQEILQFLPDEQWISFVMEDFKVMELSQDVMLATYTITRNSDISLRSSLWKYNGCNWQIVFHQGTRL